MPYLTVSKRAFLLIQILYTHIIDTKKVITSWTLLCQSCVDGLYVNVEREGFSLEVWGEVPSVDLEDSQPVCHYWAGKGKEQHRRPRARRISRGNIQPLKWFSQFICDIQSDFLRDCCSHLCFRRFLHFPECKGKYVSLQAEEKNPDPCLM